MQLLITLLSIDVFCITETWLDNNVSDNEIAFDNYVLYRKDWPHNKGRGLCCYVKNSLTSSSVDFTDSGIHEMLWISILVKLEPLCNGKTNIVITGDFNLDILSTGGCQSRFKHITDLCNLFGFTELIHDPTSVTPSSSTLVDHMYSNMD